MSNSSEQCYRSVRARRHRKNACRLDGLHTADSNPRSLFQRLCWVSCPRGHPDGRRTKTAQLLQPRVGDKSVVISIHKLFVTHLQGLEIRKGRRRPRLSQPITAQEYNHTTTIHNNEQAIAGPSTGSGSSTIARSKAVQQKTELEKQQDILKELTNGDGITKYDWVGLIEKCDACGHYFLSSVLNKHIPACVQSSQDD